MPRVRSSGEAPADCAREARRRRWGPGGAVQGGGHVGLATGTNPLDFDGPNSCPRIQNPPVKKPMTRHEFNFFAQTHARRVNGHPRVARARQQQCWIAAQASQKLNNSIRILIISGILVSWPVLTLRVKKIEHI